MIKQKPRTMQQVMRDIDYMINNNKDFGAISCDIAQLKAQLDAVERCVKRKDRSKADAILNPCRDKEERNKVVLGIVANHSENMVRMAG